MVTQFMYIRYMMIFLFTLIDYAAFGLWILISIALSCFSIRVIKTEIHVGRYVGRIYIEHGN
mgnify:CR=1